MRGLSRLKGYTGGGAVPLRKYRIGLELLWGKRYTVKNVSYEQKTIPQEGGNGPTASN